MKITYNRSVARVYYYFVLGAIGGVSGWFLIALLGRNPTDVPTLGLQLVQGAILGSLIGLGGGVFDGLAAHSSARVLKFGGTSMMLGLLAGCIAVPLVQLIYGTLRGGSSGQSPSPFLAFASGVLCWVIFGGLIGFGEGVSKGSETWKGMVGGMAGGAVGGGFYEWAGRNASKLGDARSEQSALALAMLLLGGFVGAAVALTATILKGARLLIENGKLKGHDIPISKYVDKILGSLKPGIIGSDQFVAIYLPGDPEVCPRHASISYTDGMPTLTVLPDARQRRAVTRVNGRSVATSWPLSNGDRLEIGSTRLLYSHTVNRAGSPGGLRIT